MAQRRSLDYSTDQYNTQNVTPTGPKPVAVRRQPAGMPMPTTVGPSDYYSAFNDYLNQGYTGAQAVGKAALKFPDSSPTSADNYATSDAYQQAAALPKGQSVGQESKSQNSNLLGNYTNFGQAWLQSGGRTPQDLAAFVKAHPEYGATIGGSKGDKVTIGGRTFDAVIGAGAGGLGGSFNDITDGGGGGETDQPGITGTPIDFSQILNSVLSQQIIPQEQSGVDRSAVADALKGIFQNGGNFNQDIVDRRANIARDQLNTFKKSQQASDQASLAERGLLGSGPEITAQNRLGSNIADQYSQALSGIIADESQNADSRMMQALSLAAGLSDNDLDRLLQEYQTKAQTGINLGQLQSNYDLGLGNLALGNLNSVNNYNLGVAQVGAQRDALQNQQLQDFINQLIAALGLDTQNVSNANQGFI